MCIGTIRYTSISSEIQILTLGISLSMFSLEDKRFTLDLLDVAADDD